ncbi:MAG: SET domain-containing protein-lysine N-methyltransferase, partial [Verrucomicrobiota bacterium]|nr:SET domain-containing protein-lysine N-methyltransferase [Verrucomicrobiota bacterium]
MKKTPNDLVKVRRSHIHGRGVFAIAPIRKGKRIIEYAGERVTWKDAQEAPPHRPDEPHHTFLFSLDDKWVIDAGQEGNEARWINHSCEPNCETGEAKKRIYVYALRDIFPGEELYYDYQIEPAARRT